MRPRDRAGGDVAGDEEPGEEDGEGGVGDSREDAEADDPAEGDGAAIEAAADPLDGDLPVAAGHGQPQEAELVRGVGDGDDAERDGERDRRVGRDFVDGPAERRDDGAGDAAGERHGDDVECRSEKPALAGPGPFHEGSDREDLVVASGAAALGDAGEGGEREAEADGGGLPRCAGGERDEREADEQSEREEDGSAGVGAVDDGSRGSVAMEEG